MTDLKTLFKSAENKAMSQAYALTFTLKPQLYKHVAELQYSRTFMELIQVFKRHGIKITLFTELTKQYNVHYHGIANVPMALCKSRPAQQVLFDVIRQLPWIGKSTIDPVTDEQGWNRYLCKDQTAEHWQKYPSYREHTELETIEKIIENRDEYWILKTQDK